MKIRAILPSVAAIAALAACSSHDSGLTPQASVDTLPGGIVSITSNRPLDPGEWSLVHERDVAPPAGAPGELLDPQDIALADDGTLYVVENNPAVVNVYGQDGNFVRTIGREGSGPGEFMAGFIALRGDTLVLQDPQQSRATIFDANTGKELRVFTSGCCAYGPIAIDAKGRAWIKLLDHVDSAGVATPQYLRLSITSGSIDSITTPKPAAANEGPAWNVTNSAGLRFMSVTVPMVPQFIETVDPTGGLVAGYGATYQLRRSSEGRDTVTLFGRPYTPTPVTAAEKQRQVEAKVAQIGRMNPQVNESTLRKELDPALIPDVHPAFTRLMVFRSGAVLALRGGGDTLQARLDLFGTDNRWLDSLSVADQQLATQTYTPVALSRDHLALVSADVDGNPVIKVYRLEHEAGGE